MSSGPLPPVPDLIPISAVRKKTSSEVMGEQRPRRLSGNRAIDSARSRGTGAAPQQASLSRKARSRKSDRRREHRRNASSEQPEPSTFPANPRVNPIFVWVRQEEDRIVDVKCEDYDKRNRILLTKTAQGWRAIPRTETLVPGLKEAARSHHHHHHHHHKGRKSRKSKVRRRSTGVQATSDFEQEASEESPTWLESGNVNVESLLPSHTIQVKRSTSPRRSPQRASNVNSAVSGGAQTPTLKCSADKLSDVSPLDNLLAVAELEFNQQIRSGEWNKTSDSSIVDDNDEDLISYDKSFNNMEDDKEFMRNLEHINSLIESEENKLEMPTDFEPTEHKSEECDYTEDDDNNLAMDDILSRLEQSLRSPESTEIINCDTNFRSKTATLDDYVEDNDKNTKPVPELESYFEEVDEKAEEPENVDEPPEEKLELLNVVESSTNDDEEPTDLTMVQEVDSIDDNNCDIAEEPTDLSIPKASESPRPPSQNSEAIQSPQPSGIPAVPPSPDIVSMIATNTRPTSVFLESLLSNTSKKIALNSEVTITRQSEPLDLGKCRKSASPTVTCSEEVNSTPVSEPPAKKMKSVDITLKNLLDPVGRRTNSEGRTTEKPAAIETPRLLELLKNDLEPDPSTQLKNLLSDPTVNIPDPMLVPKDKFSLILTRPGVEIPRLLKERPELRLPEALALPHIMQDPNMLVVNIHHLESILSNKIPHENESRSRSEKVQEKIGRKSEKRSSAEAAFESPSHPRKKPSENLSKQYTTETQTKCFSELANDIDAATQAAFNQMAWLPYLNHLEAMSLANNPPTFPMYVNQMPDFSQMFGGSRMQVPPMGFPMQPPVGYGNPWEMSMWQEALIQANMLRSKPTAEGFGSERMFKSYGEKPKRSTTSYVGQRMHSSSRQQGHPSPYYKADRPHANPYMNPSPTPKHGGHRQQASKAPGTFQGGFPRTPDPEKPQPSQSAAAAAFDVDRRPKLTCKPFAELTRANGGQPIDLSEAKVKVKQHLVDAANAPKLLKQQEDVPEVGSTTASIEEMQDAHKLLWHPLFGNQQKSYTNAWNWTTVTATGE